jgi:16S rRNA (guanine527-N7)-methyltransferase
MPSEKRRQSSDHGEGLRLIRAQAARSAFELSAETAAAVLAYFDLLLAWGQRINLTAAGSVDVLASDHLPDALAVAARLARREERQPGRITRMVDAGSGGGLPAIPLALIWPAVSLTLVEATAKKVAFLRTAARHLALENRVRIENRRVEPDDEEGGFDGALSRAMLAPADWLPLGAGLVRPGGVVFCLSSHSLGSIPPGLVLVHEDRYRPDRWLAELERST